jgi:hypothetical protein
VCDREPPRDEDASLPLCVPDLLAGGTHGPIGAVEHGERHMVVAPPRASPEDRTAALARTGLPQSPPARFAWMRLLVAGGLPVDPPDEPLAFWTLRESVKRLRGEGERFMGRIRRDAQTFARRTRAEIEVDVRKVREEPRSRADRSMKDLETRGHRLVESFEKQLARVADTARKGLARGVIEELPKLAKRVGALEQRIEQLCETLEDAGT